MYFLGSVAVRTAGKADGRGEDTIRGDEIGWMEKGSEGVGRERDSNEMKRKRENGKGLEEKEEVDEIRLGCLCVGRGGLRPRIGEWNK